MGITGDAERAAFDAVRGWALGAVRLASDGSSSRDAIRKTHTFDVVTEADGAIERYLRDQVRSTFPDHGFLGEEEGGGDGSLGWQWIVDPIDGTANFATGLGGSTCSIGCRRDGELVIGAIADYSTGLIHRALAGSGEILVSSDGRTETVARPQRSPSADARVFLEFGWEDLDPVTLGVMDAIASQQLRVIRMIGGVAAALVNVAIHGGCVFGLGLRIWDVAAGIVIAREAGREVRFWDLGSKVHVIVGTAEDVADFAPIIERFGESRVPPAAT